MTLYSIFERGADEAPAVVAERFSWTAALFPPVHALAHGLWLLLVVHVLVTAAIVALATWLGVEAGVWLYIVFAAWLGFAAAGFRRLALLRRGWRHASELFAAAPETAQVEWLRRRGVAA